MSDKTSPPPTPDETPEADAEFAVEGVSSELFAEALEAVEAVESVSEAVREASGAAEATNAEEGDDAGDDVELLDADALLEEEAEAEEPGEPTEEEALRARVTQLEDELNVAQQQTKDTRDRLVRKAADFENARKRHQREKSDLSKFAGESVLKEMLPVMDDLERALQHAGDAAESTLASGVEMVVRKFGQALSRRGVTPIDPTGEPFDPTFHEAIQQVDDPDVPHNTVHQVFQKGYMLHERLLRPALVVVAQGGAPRSLAPEPDAEDEASEADAEVLEGAEAPSEPAEASSTDGQEDSAQPLEDAPSGSDNEVAGDEPESD